MRTLTNCELNTIHGGNLNDSSYNFTFLVSNTLTGFGVGALFPGFPAALGVTSVIANPILATGAIFGGYAAAKMAANGLDNYLYAPCNQPVFN